VRIAGRRAISTLFLTVFVFSCTFAARRERLIDSWKPLHYKVAITLDERLSQITNARAQITIQSLKDNVSIIDLDFGELLVDSASVDGSETRFERTHGRLNVVLPKPLVRDSRIVVTIAYRGVPKDGLILSADKSGKPSAIGDNWPDRVHHWIPTLDHPSAKAPVDFSVTAPERTLVVANGELSLVTTASGGTRTWSYSEPDPIPPYCMVIAVGEFALLQPDQADGIPISYYVPQTDRDLAVKGFGAASPSLKFFSETVAPYPYDKLALIVGATRFGGMENSSAIVFSNNLFTPRVNSDPISRVFNVPSGLVSLIAHEIAHQWFGDSLTESTWADLWLSEGFATYFSAAFVQRHEGEAAFRQTMAKDAEAYFAYAKKTRSPLFDTETESLMSLLNPNNYQKGSWVLHMLRRRLGDKAFFKGVRDFYLAHDESTASSEDLRAALEKASGVSLKEFFARWVYGAGHPQYEVSWQWQRVKNRSGSLTINLKQTQPEAAFLDPIEIEIESTKGTERSKITPTGRESVIRLSSPTRPKDIRIDPDDSILNELVMK
jgi:aminopeptidase N